MNLISNNESIVPNALTASPADIIISSGVTSSNLTVSGNKILVEDGGTVINTTLNSSSNMDLEGIALTTTVNTKSTIHVKNGGYASGGTMSGTTSATIEAGGTIEDINFQSASTAYVQKDGFINGGYFAAGSVVQINGIVNKATLDGTVNVSAGGFLTRASCLSDEAVAITIENGGTIAYANRLSKVMFKTGSYSSAGMYDAGCKIEAGAKIVDATFVTGAFTYDPTAMIKGIFLQDNGMIASPSSGTTVIKLVYLNNKGGIFGTITQTGSHTGFISELSVQSGKTMKAYVTGKAYDLYGNDSGTLYVKDSGKLYNSIAEGNQIFTAMSGGLIHDCTAQNKGTIIATAGGYVANVIVDGGLLKLSSAGVYKGMLEVKNGGSVQLASKACGIDFDLNYYRGKSLFSNMMVLGQDQSNRNYTNYVGSYYLTICDVEHDGNFVLANGLDLGFDKSITVRNSAFENLGSISVGNTFKHGDVSYTLTLENNNSLVLTVEGAKSACTNPLQLDANGSAALGGKQMAEVLTLLHDGKTSDVTGHKGKKFVAKSGDPDDYVYLAKDTAYCLDVDGATFFESDNTAAFGFIDSSSNTCLKITGASTSINGEIHRTATNGQRTYTGIFNASGIVIDAPNVVLGNISSLCNGIQVKVNEDAINPGASFFAGPLLNSHAHSSDSIESVTLVEVGDISCEISDSKIEGDIYAGICGLRMKYSQNATAENVYLTIDLSNGGVQIDGDIFMGGFGFATTLGNTKLEFTGDGDLLEFEGTISGDSNGYPWERYVKGDRILSFNEFSGDFDASITNIDTLQFSSLQENMTFTKEKLNLFSVSNWEFNADNRSSAHVEFGNSVINDFTNDTLVFNYDDSFDEDEFTLIDAQDINAFAGFGETMDVSLNIDGTESKAVWNGEGFVANGYILKVDETNAALVCAKLA